MGAMASNLLASGAGWRVSDVVCTAGPHDRPFEEQHADVSIAAVTQGTFQYRTTQGAALLAPGALLLGSAGSCFECGHEHATGDRCLALHFAPDYFEAIVGSVPGARRADFVVPRLPPAPALAPAIGAVEAARDGGDAEELQEAALRLAGAVAAALVETGPEAVRQPSRRDERRITDVLRWIETEAHERLGLADLARQAGMSPYHFLRTFRQVVGMTPHQYVLRTRLHRAAVRLRRSNEPISTIAFESGFDDLSTFNRRFRRIVGASPGAYRGRGAPSATGPIA